jgi:8-oxo-dGTP pyrophosphatase MutT (NUDIX family)
MRAMLDRLPMRRRKTLSCGILVVLDSRELLLCHVTGQRQWDLPKGGIQPGETPCEAALRETQEETGLDLARSALVDLGRHDYTTSKDLHLFACLSERVDPRGLECTSCFTDRRSGRTRPEMDGFGWFGFGRIGALCTPPLARVLGGALDLDRIVSDLVAGRERLAA